MQQREARRRSRAARTAIEPAGGHDNGILRRLDSVAPFDGAGEFRLIYRVDARVFGVHCRKLLCGRGLDCLADGNEVARLVPRERESEIRSLNDAIDHSTVRNVDTYGADAGHLHVPVAIQDKGRYIAECHTFAAPS